MKEKWKWIPRFRGLYKASTKGRIKSVDRMAYSVKGRRLHLKGRILKPYIADKGYMGVNLYKNGKVKGYYVHQLVLFTFVGPKPKGMGVCHFPDKDPRNNCIENIRWGTQKDNVEDRIKHGDMLKGTEIHGAKLNEKRVKKIRRLYRKGVMRQQELADKYGVGQMAISNVINRVTWRHVL